jgi:autotransporter-associated beta strand protein
LTVGNTGISGTFSGVIQNNTGAVSLTKIGLGTETLSGANTYTGATTIVAGNLQISGSVTSAVSVNKIATIAASPTGATESGSTVTITTTAANPFTRGDQVIIAGVGVAGYNGTFTITSVLSATKFQYLNATTGLAGSGGGTATGGGGMLNGSGTITGAVTVNAGGFLLPGDFVAGAGTNALTVAGNVTFNAAAELFVIANTATDYSQLIVSGAHTVTLGSATVGVSQNYTPRGSFNIAASPTGATEAGSTVTITTTTAHTFQVGDQVLITGVGVAGYNGTFTITSVTSTTFTYTDSTTGLAASGGGTAASDNLTIISAASSTLSGTFNTTFPHNVSSGFFYGKGFVYGPGATVVLMDPSPENGTSIFTNSTSIASTAVFLPAPQPQEFQDVIQALAAGAAGEPRSLPATLADTIGPIGSAFEHAAVFARSSPPSEGTNAWQFRSEHVGGGFDDPGSADTDLPPTVAEIDAFFSSAAQ